MVRGSGGGEGGRSIGEPVRKSSAQLQVANITDFLTPFLHTGCRSRLFRKTNITSPYVNLRLLDTLTSASRSRCSTLCSRDVLCDAFAVPSLGSDAGTCRLWTLEDSTTFSGSPLVVGDWLDGFDLYMANTE